MFRVHFLAVVLALAAITTASADEAVRQAQEELRRRNLYFGDVDGRATSELSGALKRYQERKGFEATGMLDEQTIASLGLRHTPGEEAQANWPEIPVLRSDKARDIGEPQRVALERRAAENPDAIRRPPPPAESPAPSQNLNPQQVQQFVESYLRDAETDNVDAQIGYFTFPLEYLWHGQRDRDYVRRDFTNYVKRWTTRKYRLAEPVQFYAASGGNETIVEFSMDFDVKNHKHHVTGRTWNVWAIRPEGDELKIVSISEERLRD
jgi:hypothetical protein